MLGLLFVMASAGAAPLQGPIEEVDHPRYRDAVGRPVAWSEIRKLAKGTEAARQVRRRRWGRTLLRTLFAGATAVEIWGTWKLAQQENYLAVPLGAQAATTGLVAVLLWTNAPQARREDRAYLLDGANGVLPSP